MFDSILSILRSKIFALIAILVFAGLQFLFLSADPDVNISFSRDAFTDEGLYTSQLRNHINTGQNTASESDAYVKTPLFSAWLYIPMKLLGTSREAARGWLVVSALTALILLLFNKAFRLPALLFLAIGLSEYHIFQYFHFTMAETLCVSCCLLACFFFYKCIEKPRTVYLIAALSFLSFTWMLKIQFLYLLALCPATLALLLYFHSQQIRGVQRLRFIGIAAFTMLLWIAIYYFLFYTSNKDFLNYVLSQQSGNRYPSLKELPQLVTFNIGYFFLTKYVGPLSIVTLLCIPLGIWQYRKNRSFQYRAVFCFLAAWCLLEMHKVPMTYLPARYLVSTWAAMAFFSSWVLLALLKNPFNSGFSKVVASVCIGIVVLTNGYHLQRLVRGRSYVTKEIDRYINTGIKEGDCVLGSWACNLSWSNKSYTAPVWKNYINDKNTLAKFKPRVIISEPGETDSELAFQSQGVDLAAISDSVKNFQVSQWKIQVYWIKPDALPKGK